MPAAPTHILGSPIPGLQEAINDSRYGRADEQMDPAPRGNDRTKHPIDAGLVGESFPKELGISSQHSHYMRFSSHPINGTVGSFGSDDAFGAMEEFVCLPIPTNPEATYDQGWETETAGRLKTGAILAGAEAFDGGTRSDITLDDVKNSLKGLFKSQTQQGVMGSVGSLLGSQAVGQATGKAVFDQSFAVYGGPAYRSFSFNYSLMPLDRNDAERIKNIVMFFKSNAAPNTFQNFVNRIYGLPKAFEIKYYTSKGENTYMNKIGKCALTSVGVKYGGDRFTVFDNTDVPVQVDLSLSFKELQLTDRASIEGGY